MAFAMLVLFWPLVVAVSLPNWLDVNLPYVMAVCAVWNGLLAALLAFVLAKWRSSGKMSGAYLDSLGKLPRFLLRLLRAVLVVALVWEAVLAAASLVVMSVDPDLMGLLGFDMG